MKTLPLGNTGVEVSALCLGAMYFGSKNDKATSFRLLDQYVDAGGSFLDSANIYAHWVPGGHAGDSERLLGEWMRERGNRDGLFLASKVGFAYPGIEIGLSAQQIEEECNKSLQHLGVETIDLYYAHVDDYETPLEETMEAFYRLIQAGKVRFIGASNYLAWRMEQAKWTAETHGWEPFCCIQQRYSYLRPNHNARFGMQQVGNPDLLDFCKRRGVTLLAYSAMLGGCFTRDDRPVPEQYVGPDSDQRLAALREVAAETGATVSQIVLAWMLHSDPVVLPLIAASSPEVMADSLGALEVSLSDEQMQRLNAAGV